MLKWYSETLFFSWMSNIDCLAVWQKMKSWFWIFLFSVEINVLSLENFCLCNYKIFKDKHFHFCAGVIGRSLFLWVFNKTVLKQKYNSPASVFLDSSLCDINSQAGSWMKRKRKKQARSWWCHRPSAELCVWLWRSGTVNTEM